MLNLILMYLQIKDGANPAFYTVHALLNRIDALPDGPDWMCTLFWIKGNVVGSNGALKMEDAEL